MEIDIEKQSFPPELTMFLQLIEVQMHSSMRPLPRPELSHPRLLLTLQVVLTDVKRQLRVEFVNQNV